ncbi:Ribosomal protein S8 family protein (apicoplast) [Babesia bovis T2Bo]|uniref:Rps8 n=1 Tax=Babesia bovis TaxID=5865 RepID=A7AXG5_BABBO|nr:Ribosomal protein S8 family protein [Babesia bovis T2Bo]EDO05088.1 Ribosomal protein S8 family protein [Babesia bovis T2Bo]|eukprot:YP_002290868.1 rps8 (apicoplast) [Babesia bovis T2Bo]
MLTNNKFPLNIQNKHLVELIYKKCILLNYMDSYNFIKINDKIYKSDVSANIKHMYIKNFYKISSHIYLKHKEIKNMNKNLKSGVLLLSTPIGILTSKKAEILRTGGVLICYIS